MIFLVLASSFASRSKKQRAELFTPLRHVDDMWQSVFQYPKILRSLSFVKKSNENVVFPGGFFKNASNCIFQINPYNANESLT